MALDISKNPFLFNYHSLNLCNLCNKGQPCLNYSNPILIQLNDKLIIEVSIEVNLSNLI